MDLHTVTIHKKDIESFLVEMKSILCSPDFDIDRDFMFTDIRANDDPDDEYHIHQFNGLAGEGGQGDDEHRASVDQQ